MKLFILGGSGLVGRHLITLARAQGHDVTALVRAASRAKLPASSAAGEGSLTVLTGEVVGGAGGPDVLVEGMRGHDAVLSSLGIQRRSPANPWSQLTSPADFCSRSAQRIVGAMGSTGVKRLVAVSAAGVADSAPAMNALMKALVATSNVGVAYRDLAVMEDVYRSAGIDWLCPRPTRLTDGPATDQAHVTDAFPMNAAISRIDVAAWMLAALAVDSWSRAWPTRTPQVTSVPAAR